MAEDLYDESLLVDFESSLPAGLRLRPLRSDDHEKGFLSLLSQLTVVGDVTEPRFKERFSAMKACKDHYFVTVIEDTATKRVIAASTLAIELKFIRNCALRGRLEDVVVSETYRGKNLGKIIVQVILHLARRVGCYKLSLDCKDNLIPFYQASGFQCEPGNANTMVIRL